MAKAWVRCVISGEEAMGRSLPWRRPQDNLEVFSANAKLSSRSTGENTMRRRYEVEDGSLSIRSDESTGSDDSRV